MNPKALALMRKTAHRLGYTVKPNSRGDWSVRSNGLWRGIIIVIESDFDPGSPVAIACRHNNYPELSDLRHEMNQDLMRNGYLQPAEDQP